MNICSDRDELYRTISKISGVIEKRQTLPILSNIVLRSKGKQLAVTATDLEIQITTTCELREESASEFTIPARKFYDICRNLINGSVMKISVTNEKATISSGKSKFVLSTLPAADYPAIEEQESKQSLVANAADLLKVVEKTAFSMAQQDVRYYLNGMLFEIEGDQLRCVATDGHRLALSDTKVKDYSGDSRQIIVPRKAVIELGRVIDQDDTDIEIQLSEGFLKFVFGQTIFISKIIDGKYPDYQRVIPDNLDISVDLKKDDFKNSLIRTAILSSEKYKGVRLTFDKGVLTLQAHNPEQEQAEELIDIDYDGPSVTIGFNVNYILDVVNVIESEVLSFKFSEGGRSALIQDKSNPDNVYVVMPMRL